MPVSSTVSLLVVLAAVAVGVVAFFVALVLLLRSRKEQVGAQIAATYADPLVPPELGMYRGGTGAYSSVRSTMWLVLTADVLAMHPLMGGTPRRIGMEEITDTRRARSWRGHWNGRPVLVVTTRSGELGITVREPADWEAALQRARR